MGGFRRVWHEAAFRQELVGGLVSVLILWWIGTSVMYLAIMVMLVLALLAFEAVNTAIEVLVDHLSPDWSAFAKDAKDLGSAAVFLMICLNAIWFLISVVNTVFYA
jgi:diacylglycerol kinase (ATP)